MYIVLGVLVFLILFCLYGVLTSRSLQFQSTEADVGVNIKIGQISDVHFRSSIDIEYYRNTITKLNDENPDLIVFTGDLFQENDITDQLKQEAIDVLSLFDAPNKYAVLGNHDYYFPEKTAITKAILEAAGFTILVNQRTELTVDNQVINLIGLDDLRLGDTNYQPIMESANSFTYNIVLAHEPDTFDYVNPYPVNLMLSGHSHGGQLRLPLVPTIIRIGGAVEYFDRYYEVNDTTLYVSFGAGQSFANIRMYDPPKIDFYQCS